MERIEHGLNDAAKPVRARGSRSSGSATRAESATSASHRRCGSWKSSPSAAASSPTTTPMSPRFPSSGSSNSPLDSAVAGADAVVLVTAHPGIDYTALASSASLFIDLRGVTRGLDVANLIRL